MTSFSKRHTHCRICEVRLPAPFLMLGEQPLANNLWDAPATSAIGQYLQVAPLSLCRCEGCGLVQLDTVVDPRVLFSHYLYTPSTNPQLVRHFALMAEELAVRYELSPGDLVVDIGSNDGALLSHFKRLGMRVLGVEPATNIAKQAILSGIPTYNEFFTPATAATILADHGQAKLVTATNVFAHVDDVHRVTRGVAHLLDYDGVFVVEAPGLLEMVEQGTWDLIYAEHNSYLSVRPMKELMARHSLTLIDCQEVDAHGGSVRYISEHTGGPRGAQPGFMSRYHREAPLLDTATFLAFADGVSQCRSQLVEAVLGGGVVAGYGAPAKATVIISYCGFTSEHIKYIVDDSVLKQGKYVPGTDIPIISREQAEPVDAMVMFPWNVPDQLIMPKLVGLCKTAIVPMPALRTVEIPDGETEQKRSTGSRRQVRSSR